MSDAYFHDEPQPTEPAREIAAETWRDFPAIDIPDPERAWILHTIPTASYNLKRLVWWAMFKRDWIISTSDRWSIELARWDETENCRVTVIISMDYTGRLKGAQRFVMRPTHTPRSMDQIGDLL